MSLVAKRMSIWAALSIVGLLVLGGWWFLPGRRAEVHLSPIASEAVARFVLPARPIYLQTDPSWSSEKVGGSGEPIRWVGCTICCLSMALAQYDINLAPPTLNQKLKENGGYTYRGWVRWNAVERVSGGKIRVELPSNPSSRDIDQALADGNPVLVKVILRSGAQHWVLLVGRDQKDYLMKNPLGNGQSLEPLSSLGSEIRAVRFLKRT